MDILASGKAAPRIAQRLRRPDRLVCMTPDGKIRWAGRTIPSREARPEVAWLTPDVLMDRGIRVSNAHVNAIPVAEFVLASVLEHYQQLGTHRVLQRDRIWHPREFREIYATTWLVIGLGAAGSEVAKRAEAFGARVLGVRRRPSGTEPVHELLTPPELLGHVHRADVIVLAVPGTSGTHHLVDAAFLERIRLAAILVNVARGSIVDETALLASLDDGRPELAVLDTVATEPLPADSPLWAHERVRITCHTAALGLGRLARGTELFLGNLTRYCRGKILINELLLPEQRHDVP